MKKSKEYAELPGLFYADDVLLSPSPDRQVHEVCRDEHGKQLFRVSYEIDVVRDVHETSDNSQQLVPADIIDQFGAAMKFDELASKVFKLGMEVGGEAFNEFKDQVVEDAIAGAMKCLANLNEKIGDMDNQTLLRETTRVAVQLGCAAMNVIRDEVERARGESN